MIEDVKMKEFAENIGERMAEKRKACNVTQEEIGKATGNTKNYISALERGVNKISLYTFVQYCDYLGITPNEMLGYESKNEGKQFSDDDMLDVGKTMITLMSMDRSDRKRVSKIVETFDYPDEALVKRLMAYYIGISEAYEKSKKRKAEETTSEE